MAKDNNGINTLLGTSNSDGETTVSLYANASNELLTSDGTTGLDLSDDIASRDDNSEPAMMAVSELDGTTPVALYADPTTHSLLIDST